MISKGDEIRVVSPSNSLNAIGGMEAFDKSLNDLEKLGFKVTFGKNIDEHDILGSASITKRIEDIHEAYLDDNVRLILTTIGGYTSNELLPYLNYELIKQNPKPFCGYSDFTALNNGLYAKTGLTTYSGATFSSFKMDGLQEYQTEAWLNALTHDKFVVTPSKQWSSDSWYLPDEPRTYFETEWKVYNEGQVEGVAIGGNLNTFNLLNGTEYSPIVDDIVLFIESAEEKDYLDFTRDLASALQVIKNLKGLLIGRFPKESKMTEEKLHYILDKHPILKTIPVMYDLDFGHTQPIFTFPIGANVSFNTEQKELHFNTHSMSK